MMKGENSKMYNSWKEEILKSLAHIEAYIDFGEDDDIGHDIFDECNGNIGRFPSYMFYHDYVKAWRG